MILKILKILKKLIIGKNKKKKSRWKRKLRRFFFKLILLCLAGGSTYLAFLNRKSIRETVLSTIKGKLKKA